jgi:HEAT repeat protein
MKKAMQRWMGWGIFLLVVAFVIGSAIMNNINTNRLLDDAVSGEPSRQKSSLTSLAEREDFFDLLQSRETPQRLKIAQGVESLDNAAGVKVGLAMLRDPEPRVRERFIESLKKIAPHNLDSFVDGLKHADSNVKNGTVAVMAFVGEPSLPVALKAVENVDARVAAGNVLVKLGAASVPGLLKILKETQDEVIRLFVIETLGKIGDKRATPAILPYLSLTPEKKRIVIGALGLIADPATEHQLIESLQNPEEDADARVQAAMGLGKIGTPSAISALIQALDNENLKIGDGAVTGLQQAGEKALGALKTAAKHPDPDVRIRVAQALGGIESAGAVGGLSALLNDGDIRVQRASAQALGETGRAETVPVLLRALSMEDGGVVQAASESLKQIGSPAIPVLRQALQSPDSTLAYYAASTLAQIGPEATPVLIQAAQQPNSRKWALIALAQMHAPEAKPLFEQALKTGDPALQQIAREALMGMRP